MIAEDDKIIMRNLVESALRQDEERILSLLSYLNIDTKNLQNREIVRKVLYRLYEIAKRVKSEKQYLFLTGIAISSIRTYTLENELDYLSYIIALEEIDIENLQYLVITFRRLPILVLDLLDKIDTSYYNLRIDSYDDIKVKLKLVTDLQLNYIIRKMLYPLTISTELVDTLLRRIRRISIKRLIEINYKILQTLKDSICRNIRKLLDADILDELDLSDEITIIDYHRNKISGKLCKQTSLKDDIFIESVDKVVKIGDIIVIWHI
ncbi:MAG: hypothetical protein GXO10_07550 [Crenarchaeota archaeon]|nr:hypothetical protein [Thermoproteota archaeon]